MDKVKELAGLVAEELGLKGVKEVQEAQKKNDEEITKLKENNAELKATIEKAEGKKVDLTVPGKNTKKTFIYKGYDVKRQCMKLALPPMDVERREGHAKFVIDMFHSKALTESNTGQHLVPVEYEDDVLALATLSSVALQDARIITVGTNSFKYPALLARPSVDHQAFGTANTNSEQTYKMLTFTIDKRIGDYQEIYNDLLEDSVFDITSHSMNLIAEAIGQEVDSQVFNGTEFTTYLLGSAGKTIDCTGADINVITYDNLVDAVYGAEIERAINPKWYFHKNVMAAVMKLKDTTGDPIFQRNIAGAPNGTILGYPVRLVSAMPSAPAATEEFAIFGDLKYYVIAQRQGMIFQVNPYVKMKEGVTQFIGYARYDGNVGASSAFSELEMIA